MAWIRTILREIFGLFIDDSGFALAILSCLAVVGLVFPRFGVSSAWDGAILFVGLALILIESVVRKSGR